MCPRRQSQSQRHRPSCWDLGRLHPGRGMFSKRYLLGIRRLFFDISLSSPLQFALSPECEGRRSESPECLRYGHSGGEEAVKVIGFLLLPRSLGSARPSKISSLHLHVNRAFLQDSVGHIPQTWHVERILWSLKWIKHLPFPQRYR